MRAKTILWLLIIVIGLQISFFSSLVSAESTEESTVNNPNLPDPSLPYLSSLFSKNPQDYREIGKKLMENAPKHIKTGTDQQKAEYLFPEYLRILHARGNPFNGDNSDRAHYGITEGDRTLYTCNWHSDAITALFSGGGIKYVIPVVMRKPYENAPASEAVDPNVNHIAIAVADKKSGSVKFFDGWMTAKLNGGSYKNSDGNFQTGTDLDTYQKLVKEQGYTRFGGIDEAPKWGISPLITLDWSGWTLGTSVDSLNKIDVIQNYLTNPESSTSDKKNNEETESTKQNNKDGGKDSTDTSKNKGNEEDTDNLKDNNLKEPSDTQQVQGEVKEPDNRGTIETEEDTNDWGDDEIEDDSEDWGDDEIEGDSEDWGDEEIEDDSEDWGDSQTGSSTTDSSTPETSNAGTDLPPAKVMGYGADGKPWYLHGDGSVDETCPEGHLCAPTIAPSAIGEGHTFAEPKDAGTFNFAFNDEPRPLEQVNSDTSDSSTGGGDFTGTWKITSLKDGETSLLTLTPNRDGTISASIDGKSIGNGKVGSDGWLIISIPALEMTYKVKISDNGQELTGSITYRPWDWGAEWGGDGIKDKPVTISISGTKIS